MKKSYNNQSSYDFIMILQNVRNYLPDVKASHHRRLKSSAILLWDPPILNLKCNVQLPEPLAVMWQCSKLHLTVAISSHLSANNWRNVVKKWQKSIMAVNSTSAFGEFSFVELRWKSFVTYIFNTLSPASFSKF
jgi:hypothetical protein